MKFCDGAGKMCKIELTEMDFLAGLNSVKTEHVWEAIVRDAKYTEGYAINTIELYGFIIQRKKKFETVQENFAYDKYGMAIGIIDHRKTKMWTGDSSTEGYIGIDRFARGVEVIDNAFSEKPGHYNLSEIEAVIERRTGINDFSWFVGPTVNAFFRGRFGS